MESGQFASLINRGAFTKGVNQKVLDYAKAGYFKTDLETAEKIGGMLDIAPGVNALEPCIGDGGAFFTVTRSQPDVKKYAVELREEAAYELADSGKLECCLQGDFLHDLRCSNNSFDLVFCNPPYGLEEKTALVPNPKRLETLFLARITQLIRNGGLLIWIVPHIMTADQGHVDILKKNYSLQGLYRFPTREFEKYHQLVFFLRKQPLGKRDFPDLSAYAAREEAQGLPEVPDHVPEDKKLIVTACAESRVREFKKKELDAGRALMALSRDEARHGVCPKLWIKPWDLHEKLVVPRFHHWDELHLDIAGGVGGGLAGSGQKRFLYRGTIKHREDETDITNIDPETGKERSTSVRVRSYSTASIAVVTNSPDEPGRIVRLGVKEEEE